MFVGRERELSLLNELWGRPHASFVVCKGRRRIGKSTLIQQFGRTADVFLEFQGAAPAPGLSERDQMAAVIEQLCAQTGIPRFRPESWHQVFAFLAMTVSQERRTVILLDEISWMAARSPAFEAQLKIAWDTKFKPFPNLVLVICGSVSSWIDEHILSSTGFMGRVSLELTPRELPLHHCDRFWREKRDRISSMEKLKVLSVTGGVPRYLEEINPALTAEENIRRLCFEKEGILYHEFDRIFSDIFDRRADTYRKIARALVTGSKTLSTISDELEATRGGHITRYLNEMIAAEFVTKDTVYSARTGRESKLAAYRLKDNYVRFYLRYIEPLSDRIGKGLLEGAALEDLVQWDSIMGIQFENLVLNNISSIFSLLSLSPSSISSAAPYFQTRTAHREACQVDLMIRTRYSAYVCEIKFRKRIGLEVIDEMMEKISKIEFRDVVSVRPVLIYEGQVAEQVQRADFFDRLIRFSDLLEGPAVSPLC